MKSPQVIISILNWNGGAKTLACLESLQALNYPNYSIIVTDNHSRDNSVERIRAAYPDVELLSAATNLGFASGHRLALEHIQPRGADLFWMLNNDTLVRPDTLSALVDAYRRWGHALYGSVWLDTLGSAPRLLYGGGWELDTHGQPVLADYNPYEGMTYADYLTHHPERAVATLSGGSLVVPLAVIQQHGFLDEAFFFYLEDMDYCLRLGGRGVPAVIVPTSVIVHEHHGSFGGRPRLAWVRTYYRQRNHMVFIRRYQGWRAFSRLVWAEMVFCLRAWLLSVWQTRRLGVPEKYRDRYLALRDVLLNRMGKTVAPEDFMD